MRNLLVLPVLALLLAGASPALLADDDERWHAGYHLAATDIVAMLEAQGFYDFDEVELDDGRYEVEARAPDGREVELEIDAHTGAIIGLDFED